MTEAIYHTPVLLREAVDALNIQKGGIYVDVTFGGGGHSREILSRMDDSARLIAFDQDPDAQANVTKDSRFTFIAANFRFLKNYLRMHGIKTVNGILADLGVSSHQFDVPERGFTIRQDVPLDMRMNKAEGMTAADLLNTYEEARLAQVLYRFGELRNSRPLAKAIVDKRAIQPLASSGDLAEALKKFIPPQNSHSFMARVFQALRMEVNNEQDALNEFLMAANELLAPGGRLVVISYHSLEDRPVKLFMRTGDLTGQEYKDFYGNLLRPLQPLQAKAIIPSDAEIRVNNRARSAKMRVAEKL